MKIKSSISAAILALFALINLCTLCTHESEPVNNPPIVGFSSPKFYSCFLPGDNIMIILSVNDQDNDAVSVNIQLNGNTIASMNTAPYETTYLVENLDPGNYTLKAVATDVLGDTASSNVSIAILPDPETFTDQRDGMVYRYVEIGTQAWMVDNLSYLPGVNRSDDSSTTEPRYYVYNYDGTDVATAKLTENYLNTGALYNFEAAKIACPEGWHLPSFGEWDTLIDYLATNHTEITLIPETRGNIWSRIGKYLRSTSGWTPEKANGLNTYGFSAIPAGAESFGIDYLYCQPCNKVDDIASWWSSSSVSFKYAYAFDTSTEFGDIYESARKNDHHKVFGLSVRCIKDN